MITALIATAALGLPVQGSSTAFDLQKPIYQFNLIDIDGKKVEMSQHKGKVLLIVNVASKCGLTPQYNDMQYLHERFREQGLVVMGFPCNQFGGQEPGTEKDIKAFAQKEYGVTFPLFQKIEVNGEGAHPLFKWLIAKAPPPKDIEWNFAKFLIARDGVRVTRFESKMTMGHTKFLGQLELLLYEK